MRVEVIQHFGSTLPLSQAGYFETAHHQQLIKDIKGAIFEGRLIALCGVIGSGKTVMLRRLQQVMEAEKKITVSKSFAIEKHTIKLASARFVHRKTGGHPTRISAGSFAIKPGSRTG
jgi:type II secretory pathway predicted ATPase ExeA